VLYAAGKLDPDGASGAIARSERRRHESMGWLAGRLQEDGHLRADITPERAAHLVWLLASFDAYVLLASGRGLGPDDVAQILIDAAERALLR
jgi:hypothetical protein